MQSRPHRRKTKHNPKVKVQRWRQHADRQQHLHKRQDMSSKVKDNMQTEKQHLHKRQEISSKIEDNMQTEKQHLHMRQEMSSKVEGQTRRQHADRETASAQETKNKFKGQTRRQETGSKKRWRQQRCTSMTQREGKEQQRSTGCHGDSHPSETKWQQKRACDGLRPNALLIVLLVESNEWQVKSTAAGSWERVG